mmetsp:Transcript_71403/g.214645  ORF Transcript_71403/g.214645 Transcript_71403/m.214645 type:complete len:393 (-) Transcript_71403:23-1201(-)
MLHASPTRATARRGPGPNSRTAFAHESPSLHLREKRVRRLQVGLVLGRRTVLVLLTALEALRRREHDEDNAVQSEGGADRARRTGRERQSHSADGGRPSDERTNPEEDLPRVVGVAGAAVDTAGEERVLLAVGAQPHLEERLLLICDRLVHEPDRCEHRAELRDGGSGPEHRLSLDVKQERRGHQSVEKGGAEDDRSPLESRRLVERLELGHAVVARLKLLAPEEEEEEPQAVRRDEGGVDLEQRRGRGGRRGEGSDADAEHGQAVGKREDVRLTNVAKGPSNASNGRCSGHGVSARDGRSNGGLHGSGLHRTAAESTHGRGRGAVDGRGGAQAAWVVPVWRRWRRERRRRRRILKHGESNRVWRARRRERRRHWRVVEHGSESNNAPRHVS